MNRNVGSSNKSAEIVFPSAFIFENRFIPI